jgi:glycosyltransferase involved in cell wall biosynthesis
LPRPSFSRPRVLIDVSHIAAADARSGIQRVVRESVGALVCTDRAGVDPIAVELVNGKLRVAAAWLDRHGLRMAIERRTGVAETIAPRPGDVLLMLDSSWARWPEFAEVFAECDRAGVPVITAVYDLLPILCPEDFLPPGPSWFEAWFRGAAERSDGLVCISRSVAAEVDEYLDRHGPWARRPPVTHWRLGAGFAASALSGEPSARVRSALAAPGLLMVGTIEPRKRHALALGALERLWADGDAPPLVVAGRAGWLVDDLVARLRSHPEAGRRLHWIEDPDDEELLALYSRSAGLLFLSRGEGFGLPLVEAAAHGLPILCSRLAVFAEVAGAHAAYLDAEDPEGIAREISTWWRARAHGNVPDSRRIPRLSWEESAEELLSVVLDPTWRRRRHGNP